VNSKAKGSNQRWAVFGSEKQIIVSLPAPQIILEPGIWVPIFEIQ
jgi:hypothetical protein